MHRQGQAARCPQSGGASRAFLHRAANLKVEKAHFAPTNENCKNDVEIVAPSVPPPEALYDTVTSRVLRLDLVLGSGSLPLLQTIAESQPQAI